MGLAARAQTQMTANHRAFVVWGPAFVFRWNNHRMKASVKHDAKKGGIRDYTNRIKLAASRQAVFERRRRARNSSTDFLAFFNRLVTWSGTTVFHPL